MLTVTVKKSLTQSGNQRFWFQMSVPFHNSQVWPNIRALILNTQDPLYLHNLVVGELEAGQPKHQGK